MRRVLLAVPALAALAALALPAQAAPPSSGTADYRQPFSGYTGTYTATCRTGSTCTATPTRDASGSGTAQSSYRRDTAEPYAGTGTPPEREFAFSDAVHRVTFQVPAKARSITITAHWSGLQGQAAASSTLGRVYAGGGLVLCVSTCQTDDPGVITREVSAASINGLAQSTTPGSSVSGTTAVQTLTFDLKPRTKSVTIYAYPWTNTGGESADSCETSSSCLAVPAPTAHAGTSIATMTAVLDSIHVEAS